MSRRIVGPFNRVEGDLEVQLEIVDDRVEDAYVVSTLYRGFEQILHGKDPRDALIYAPRICGICSVSQSSAAAQALSKAMNLHTPQNGERVANLILAAENIADHLTHFYLFFMPDFARQIYRDEPWYDHTATRFKAIKGTAHTEFLTARAAFMHILGLLAGKWPHTLTIQPGGSTKSVAKQEKARLMATLVSFRQFLETTLFGAPLEMISGLSTEVELDDWLNRASPEMDDFRHFLHLAKHLDLHNLGKSGDRFMSYGAYRFEEQPLFDEGLFHQNAVQAVDQQLIREDLTSSWLSQDHKARHPFEGVTIPDHEADGGYSWCKAPRLDGKVIEVGALARQLVDGHPLIQDLVLNNGGNVRERVVSRLLEVARLIPIMEQWVRDIKPGEPFCAHGRIPDEADGVGLVEAARGSLGHWLRIKNGRIFNYQIVAPTTWNFSPRDAAGVPGALEHALIGAPVRNGEKDPVAVQHIVRSFDPCMVCTVH